MKKGRRGFIRTAGIAGIGVARGHPSYDERPPGEVLQRLCLGQQAGSTGDGARCAVLGAGLYVG